MFRCIALPPDTRKLCAMPAFIPLLLLLALGAAARAQGQDTTDVPLIQDNSFLVEEAYNQEASIVQHILTFQQNRGLKGFDGAFTQEWPVGSIRHQLSYDLPLLRGSSSTGIGDVALNYRYQLRGDGNAVLAVAPRFSVILPTGDWKRARGAGAVGFDVGLPVSYVLSPLLVTHMNPTVTLIPSARNQVGKRATATAFSYGQSLIYTVSRAIQPMIEAVYSREQEVVGAGSTEGVDSFVISPGVRAAFNFSSGLQIVPGIAVPIGVGPSRGERSLFVYLSFEHGFGRQ